MSEKTFGFIGCGNMGGALATAACKSGVGRVLLANRTQAKAEALAARLEGMGAAVAVAENAGVAEEADYIFLGVKPQMMADMLESIAPVLAAQGIWLAAQCCEHLNRAIIIEREAAEKYGWEEVCVVPRPHAGGSWATTCWKQFRDPIAVEEIRAHAGIDIGGTLIGMHLRRVAVPVRLSLNKIGEANILCAYTRPKLIGGERARYTEED